MAGGYFPNSWHPIYGGCGPPMPHPPPGNPYNRSDLKLASGGRRSAAGSREGRRRRESVDVGRTRKGDDRERGGRSDGRKRDRTDSSKSGASVVDAPEEEEDVPEAEEPVDERCYYSDYSYSHREEDEDDLTLEKRVASLQARLDELDRGRKRSADASASRRPKRRSRSERRDAIVSSGGVTLVAPSRGRRSAGRHDPKTSGRPRSSDRHKHEERSHRRSADKRRRSTRKRRRRDRPPRSKSRRHSERGKSRGRSREKRRGKSRRKSREKSRGKSRGSSRRREGNDDLEKERVRPSARSGDPRDTVEEQSRGTFKAVAFSEAKSVKGPPRRSRELAIGDLQKLQEVSSQGFMSLLAARNELWSNVGNKNVSRNLENVHDKGTPRNDPKIESRKDERREDGKATDDRRPSPHDGGSGHSSRRRDTARSSSRARQKPISRSRSRPSRSRKSPLRPREPADRDRRSRDRSRHRDDRVRGDCNRDARNSSRRGSDRREDTRDCRDGDRHVDALALRDGERRGADVETVNGHVEANRGVFKAMAFSEGKSVKGPPRQSKEQAEADLKLLLPATSQGFETLRAIRDALFGMQRTQLAEERAASPARSPSQGTSELTRKDKHLALGDKPDWKEELRQLKDLLDTGVLTQEEFQSQKRKIIEAS